MKKDLISIIVPVYNASQFLAETIQTVQNQTYQNWELLLVNDCSSDNSKEIAKTFLCDKRIHWIDLEKNSGPAIARNKGVDTAKGNYICFLDADDLWQKEKLEKQLLFMKEKKCAFSFTSYEFANEKGVPNGKKVIVPEKMTYKDALKNNTISTITVMFDLALINKNALKMPNLKFVEDTATWWQILRNNYTAYGIPEIFSYYRRSPKSNSSNKLKTQKFLWGLYRQNENLCLFDTIYCLTWKNIHALLRRI